MRGFLPDEVEARVIVPRQPRRFNTGEALAVGQDDNV